MEFYGPIAIFCTGLFAGAAAYVSWVEHPARMECGTGLAATVFGPSYRRATVMQALLAAVACVAALIEWRTSGVVGWLAGGILIGAVIPFTLIVIFPTNKKLMDPALDRSSDQALALLTKWGRLHAIRTGLSLVAFVILLWCEGRDGVLSRESMLKQDLFQLRSLISQYTLDKQKAPQALEDLVTAGYLKKLPLDTMTGAVDWEPVQEDVTLSPEQ